MKSYDSLNQEINLKKLYNMENTIDYSKTLAEAKRLKLLNEIVLKEILEKADAFDASLVEIKSKPVPKMNVTKTCKCGQCKCK